MRNEKEETALRLLAAAPAVLEIYGIGGTRWKRNVAKGARIGPWLQASYRVLDEARWRQGGACLYLVSGDDKAIRYVGISRNGLKHRWRLSPAYDAETMHRLPDDQLFHSQCWKHIEHETAEKPGATFRVHAFGADELLREIDRLESPLSGLNVLHDDGESLVAVVERWLCNQSAVRWSRDGTLPWRAIGGSLRVIPQKQARLASHCMGMLRGLTTIRSCRP